MFEQPATSHYIIDELSYNYYFFQATWLTQEAEKKLSRKQDYVASGPIIPRAYLNKSGNGRHFHMCA